MYAARPARACPAQALELLEERRGARFAVVGHLRDDTFVVRPVNAAAVLRAASDPRALVATGCGTWGGMNGPRGCVDVGVAVAV